MDSNQLSRTIAFHPGFFFTKKVTPIIGVFPSANFPQEKYFSPRKVFFPKQSIFPTFMQSNVTLFSEQTHSQPERSAAKLAKMNVINVLVLSSHQSSKFGKNLCQSADFVSYIHCGADFPKHARGMIRITLDPSIWYLALSRIRKRDNQQCLPACKFY